MTRTKKQKKQDHMSDLRLALFFRNLARANLEAAKETHHAAYILEKAFTLQDAEKNFKRQLDFLEREYGKDGLSEMLLKIEG